MEFLEFGIFLWNHDHDQFARRFAEYCTASAPVSPTLFSDDQCECNCRHHAFLEFCHNRLVKNIGPSDIDIMRRICRKWKCASGHQRNCQDCNTRFTVVATSEDNLTDVDLFKRCRPCAIQEIYNAVHDPESTLLRNAIVNDRFFDWYMQSHPDELQAHYAAWCDTTV